MFTIDDRAPEEGRWAHNSELKQEWPEGGTVGHARPIDDPAPSAAEVARPLIGQGLPEEWPTRPETPEGNRQKARDFALARARQAQQLLEESIDWAGPEAAEEAEAMMAQVAGWVRTRHNKALPKGEAKTVFDWEAQPSFDKTGDEDAI